VNLSPHRYRKHLIAGSLLAATVAGGALLFTTVSANAADATGTSTSGPGYAAGQAPSGDQSKPQRSDEKLLTGTDATKARAAALAKYPGATIERVETDSDGVYEAHIVTTSGQHLIVLMDKSFTVTGTDQPGGLGGGSPSSPASSGA
jgi:hypothetical protein